MLSRRGVRVGRPHPMTEVLSLSSFVTQLSFSRNSTYRCFHRFHRPAPTLPTRLNSMPPTRKATHAGSWYSSSGPLCIRSSNAPQAYRRIHPGAGSKLDQELSGWLGAVESTPEAPRGFPVKGCKAIIAP